MFYVICLEYFVVSCQIFRNYWVLYIFYDIRIREFNVNNSTHDTLATASGRAMTALHDTLMTAPATAITAPATAYNSTCHGYNSTCHGYNSTCHGYNSFSWQADNSTRHGNNSTQWQKLKGNIYYDMLWTFYWCYRQTFLVLFFSFWNMFFWFRDFLLLI